MCNNDYKTNLKIALAFRYACDKKQEELRLFEDTRKAIWYSEEAEEIEEQLQWCSGPDYEGCELLCKLIAQMSHAVHQHLLEVDWQEAMHYELMGLKKDLRDLEQGALNHLGHNDQEDEEYEMEEEDTESDEDDDNGDAGDNGEADGHNNTSGNCGLVIMRSS